MKNKKWLKATVACITAFILFALTFTTFADNSDEYKEINDVEVESSNENENKVNDDFAGASSEEQKNEANNNTPAAESPSTEGTSKTEGSSVSKLRIAPESVITLNAKEVIILGENNQYIVKALQGSMSKPDAPPIRDSDWEDIPPIWEGQSYNNVLRSGFYDENSIIEADGNIYSYNTGTSIYTIPGLTATIKQLKVKIDTSYHVQFYVLTDTDLIINSGSLPGIDFSVEPQTPHKYEKQNSFYTHINSKVKIVSDYQAIYNPKYPVSLGSGTIFDIETTMISALSSVEVGTFAVIGSDVDIKSKSTKYAVKSGTFSAVRVTNASTLNIDIPSGIALSSGREVFFETGSIININVNGDGRGLEVFACPMISPPGATYPASLVITGNDTIVNITVGGTGVGIFTPLLDRGSEIKLLGGSLDVKVDDGVGIYTSASLALLSTTLGQKSINVEVQKGVAAVMSYMSESSNSAPDVTLNFVSHGESDNTLLEPGVDMPSSAGLVIFPRGYWFTSPTKNYNITAKAPKDIPGSYGIYVLPGELPNYLHLQSVNLDVSGDTGIDGDEVWLGDTSKIDSTSYGVVAGSLLVEAAQNLTLDGTEAAVRLRNFYEDAVDGDEMFFHLNNSTVNLYGGKYGVVAENRNNFNYSPEAITIKDSTLNITATEPDSVGMTFDNDPSIVGRTAVISNSNININAVKEGLIIKGFDTINLTAGATKNTIKSVADNVAIHIDTITSVTGNYDIHAISRKTTPDISGKKPALYTEGEKITLFGNVGGNPKITEEYETETTGIIKEATPYMAYADDRNVVINKGTWSAEKNNTIYPLNASGSGLSSSISVKGAKVVGTMDSGNIVSFNEPGPIYNIVFPSNFNVVGVTFNTDGGNPMPEPVTGLLVGDKIPAPTVTVEKTGYTLQHWEHNGQKWNFDTDTIATTTDMALVAKWLKSSKIVTFDKNTTDPVTNIPAAIAVDYDDLVTEPTEIPTRVGYTFSGWYKEATTTNVWNFANDKMQNNDITLYAKWDINVHNVSFNENADTDIVSGMPSDLSNVVYGTKLTDPTVTPKRVGHTFAGWYKEVAGINKWIFTSDTMPDNDLILYAKWDVNKHDLTYNGNTGLPVTQTLVVSYGMLLPKPTTDVTKEGHTLEGWYKEAGLINKWDFTTEKMPDNNVDLYAKWTINKYNISFDGNAGGATVNNMPVIQNIDFDTLVVEPVIEPDRYGFEFLGWYKDATGATPWNFAIDKVPASDVVLYAKWLKTHFNVIFDVNTGNPATKPQDLFIKAGETTDISLYQPGTSLAPKKDGYLFMGWKDVSGSYSATTFTMPREDVVLSADWADWASNITLNSEKNIVIYKEGATKDKVVSSIKTTAEIVTSNGIKETKNVEFEWDESSLSTGGVYVIKLYVLDDLGNKHYGKETIDLYVLNNPYISSADLIMLSLGEPIKLNGESWSAKLIEEKVDFSARKIVRLLHKVNQDISGIDTSTPGTYPAKLFGTVLDHFGKAIDLTKDVRAIVNAKNDISDVEKTMIDSTYFWEEVSKGLHLSKKGELWNFNKNNYKYGGDLDKAKVSSTKYDRKVYVKAEPFFKMSAEVLQILQEQNNSMLEVNLENIIWNFHSKDYKNTNKIIPTGFFDLSFKSHYIDDDIKKVVPEGNIMQLSFNMNKNWIGTPTMSVALNNGLRDSAAKGNKIYLFKYNEDTKELELIGKMDVKDGMGSIKMKEVRLRYVILDKLPGGYKDITSEKVAGLSEVKSVKSTNTSGEGFRITEATNVMNQETYNELNNDISLLNKNMDELSVINIESLIEETESTDKQLINKKTLLISGATLAVLLVILLIILIIKRRKEDVDYDMDIIK